MADVRRLVELGMVGPLAKELAAQITAGVGDKRRLSELGVVTRLASELATQIATPSSANARRLAELSMVPVLANEVASQIKGAGVVTPVLRMVSTRGDVPISRIQATLANRVMIEGRTRHVVADDCDFLQTSDGGYYATTVETALGNSQNIERALEIPAGQSGGPAGPTYVARFTYGGNNVGVIPDGSAEVITDKVFASQFGLTKFPRGLIYWHRYRRSVALNDWHPAFKNNVVGVAGEASYFSDGLQPSQLMATGSMTTPAGGASAGYSMLPLATISLVTRSIAILGCGCSLIDGSNDAFSDGSAGGGYFARGLYNWNGRAVAWGRISRGQSTLVQFVGAGSTLRSAMYKYYTDLLNDHGTNDKVVSGRTAAQVWADHQTVAADAKAKSNKIRYRAIGTLPRCSTTDSGATVVNQTPLAGFETGGSFRDPLNALMAGLAPNVDQYFNLSAAIADITSVDKWAAGKSSDTIHPNSGTPSADMGVAFNAIASQWAEV